MATTTTRTNPVSTTLATLTHVMEVKDLGLGKFEINELPANKSTPHSVKSGKHKSLSFDTPLPGIKVTGYVDVENEEIVVYTMFHGKQVGPEYTGSLQTGVTIAVNLLVVKGSIRIYKQGSELMAEVTGPLGVDKTIDVMPL